MNWDNLPVGSLGASACSPGADAQLVWADSTNFLHYRPTSTFPVLVESSNGEVISQLLDREALREYLAEPEKSQIRRLELQLPIVPQRPKPVGFIAPFGGDYAQEANAANAATSDSKVLLGAIDSICPFAHPYYRRKDSAPARPSTRVLRLWVQDEPPEGKGSPPPNDFAYGQEADRAALDAIMQANLFSPGGVDEAACYEQVQATGLRHLFSHGSAVLSLFAAPMALRSRMPECPDKPPTWSEESGPAADSDIVFVQIPQDAVQDSSSASTAKYVLDGLKYIIGCAGEKTKRIVVNISDGSSRGSHDGESIFEKGLFALLESEPRLHVVMAAGNSFNEERHAQIPVKKDTPQTLRVRIPPDCESPTFVFVRIPSDAKDLAVRVQPPSLNLNSEPPVTYGQSKAWYSAINPTQPICSVIYPKPLKDTDSAVMAVIAWAPTKTFDPNITTSPIGDWVLNFSCSTDIDPPIHLYIARNQTNPGALPRGRQARFIDPTGFDDPQRHLDPLEDDPKDPQSPIRRRGGLNSLATFSHKRLRVVGGYFYRESRPSLYSAEGPDARLKPLRKGPNAWAPADTNRALQGVRAPSGVAGSLVRVVGTSFAAPQVAREIANYRPLSKGPEKSRRSSRIKKK
jgi:hypothetical protein